MSVKEHHGGKVLLHSKLWGGCSKSMDGLGHWWTAVSGRIAAGAKDFTFLDLGS